MAPPVTLNTRVITRCAPMLIIRLIINNVSPTPRYVESLRDPVVASIKPLAIMDAIVCPDWNSDVGIAVGPVALPISIATAIVSPTARPKPSIIAPNMPDLPYFSTQRFVTSHFVAPMLYAPSRMELGTAVRTSFEIDAIVGIIIIAKMTPAVRMPKPVGVPLNIGIQSRYLDNGIST